ncbi:hypothetical protein A2961_03265 [Candidatus Woesebacteria bacterium RIFCSPLOWO2_01_FULL_39_21]|uniref:Uncharacterized protein n=1 Tax=Candidatus Woesebacteria bacterium RIFCSPLOWO2_01_FULL_39_21 TaxID=1802519 RepID=A0A1F8BJI4_9BACT|nr:MAG: hypothetical protein A2961_03265 [Candidatus Woesebacteria bacterium RIFCSPLOWO2_01_FULL_39_21]
MSSEPGVGEFSLTVDTKFRFKNGEPLETKSGPLSNLFAEITQRALEVLEVKSVVLVAGPSGIGKTELFLGNLGIGASPIEAGGIATALSRKGVTWWYENLQTRDEYLQCAAFGRPVDSEGEEIIRNIRRAQILLLDEGGLLAVSEELSAAVVKFVGDGKKFVIVGGSTASSSEQLDAMSQSLVGVGLEIGEDQRIKLVPNLLTPSQAEELLMARGGRMNQEAARAIVQRYGELEVPLMFRTVWHAQYLLPDMSIQHAVKLIDKYSLLEVVRHVEKI